MIFFHIAAKRRSTFLGMTGDFSRIMTPQFFPLITCHSFSQRTEDKASCVYWDLASQSEAITQHKTMIRMFNASVVLKTQT